MITNDNLFYTFSKNNKAIAHVKSGETIVLETIDAFGGQINSEEDKLESLDWSKVNPATGPIFVEGACRGDLLKVDILSIDVDQKGIMASIPQAGLFGQKHQTSTIKVFDVDQEFKFDNYKIPINKMIGVIGVAPDIDTPNGEPGPHGGNMDNKVIREGATLYLPVFSEGALFGLGDLHASMGDGEVNVTGIEISGRVKVRLSVIKNESHGHPLLIDDDNFYTICSAESADKAIRLVADEMLYWLQKLNNYTLSDAAMFMSLVSDIEVCQVVDPKITFRMKLPKKYLKQLI